MKPRRLALLGDFSPAALAHRAIPVALERAVAETGVVLSWDWVPTTQVGTPARDLAAYDALWAVPHSPYANPAGVVAAIQWARTSQRPFLGTCGGFQHALLEFARHAAGLPGAAHAEEEPGAAVPLLAPLHCGLVETSGTIHFAAGSRLRAVYGVPAAVEGYHCRFGLNPEYVPALTAAGLRFTATDDHGDIRAAEWPDHPFFLGTLFQPERAALRAAPAPIVTAFVRALAD